MEEKFHIYYLCTFMDTDQYRKSCKGNNCVQQRYADVMAQTFAVENSNKKIL